MKAPDVQAIEVRDFGSIPCQGWGDSSLTRGTADPGHKACCHHQEGLIWLDAWEGKLVSSGVGTKGSLRLHSCLGQTIGQLSISLEVLGDKTVSGLAKHSIFSRFTGMQRRNWNGFKPSTSPWLPKPACIHMEMDRSTLESKHHCTFGNDLNCRCTCWPTEMHRQSDGLTDRVWAQPLPNLWLNAQLHSCSSNC